MNVINFRISSKRRVIQRHIIPFTPSEGTYADRCLMEHEFIMENLKEKADWEKKEKAKRQQKNIEAMSDNLREKKRRHRRQFKVNTRFLRSELKKNGHLQCAYCGKDHLHVDPTGERLPLASTDHFIPISKGGATEDYDNMVVSCIRCNKTKKDKIIDLQEIRFMSDDKFHALQDYVKKCKVKGRKNNPRGLNPEELILIGAMQSMEEAI